MNLERVLVSRAVMIAVPLVTVPLAQAQTELYRLLGTGTVPYSHDTVADAGDVDADGVSDLLLGTYYLPGAVRIYSGRNGMLLRQHDPIALENYFGFSVAGIGDIDLDGHADYMIGVPNTGAGGAGRVHVYSGASGTIVYSYFGTTGPYFNLGWSVSGCGDVDGDGRPDFLYCSGNTLPLPSGGTAGQAYVRSGASGSLIWQIDGTFDFGPIAIVSGAGDLDADGRADFVVGAPFDSIAGYHAGKVRAYSGRTGLVLWTRPGSGSANLGLALAAAGDVDHDGHDDVVAGAPHVDDFSLGQAFVLSGASGAILRTMTGSGIGDWFGWSVDGDADWNRDGTPDIVIGAPRADLGAFNAGTVTIKSGADSTTLVELSPDEFNAGLGVAVCFADLNSDHRPEIVGQRFAGSSSVWFDPPAHYVTCAPRRNSLACMTTAGLIGTPSLSLVDDLVIGLRGVLAHQRGMLFFGRNGAHLPFHGGTLCVGSPLHRSGLLDSGGTAACTGVFQVPVSHALLLGAGFMPGDSLHVQFLYRDPGFAFPDNVVTSGSLAILLLP